MDFNGTQPISAPREQVWRLLNDPAVLAACLPGCEALEARDDGFAGTMAVKVGTLSARFSGTLTVGDVVPARSYTLVGQGQGGVAGFVRGQAAVTLEEAADGTLLRWTAKAEIGGKLMTVGGRLLHGVAQRMAAAFFERLSKQLNNNNMITEL